MSYNNVAEGQMQEQGLEEEGVADQDITVTEKDVIKSVSLTL